MTSAVLNFSSLGTNKDCFFGKSFSFPVKFLSFHLVAAADRKERLGREKKDKGKKRKRSYGEREKR